MDCLLTDTSPHINHYGHIIDWTYRNKRKWNSNPYIKSIIEENKFKIFCPQWLPISNVFTPRVYVDELTALVRHWSALVQVMACRLVGAKPLPEPTLTYCQLTLGTNCSEIWIETKNIFILKMHIKVSSSKWRPFCPRGRWDNVLQQTPAVSVTDMLLLIWRNWIVPLRTKQTRRISATQ